MSRTTIKFLNLSNDTANRNIVIFQKNTSESDGEPCVAWHVIGGTRSGATHLFSYTSAVHISASDNCDNFSPLLPAYPGQVYQVEQDQEQFTFRPTGTPSALLAELELYNGLDEIAIHANVFKDGKLLAVTGPLRPGETACFSFQDKILLGVLPYVEQGDLINYDLAVKSTTELDLRGIKSVDIILSDGIDGKKPFVFTMENIVLKEQPV